MSNNSYAEITTSSEDETSRLAVALAQHVTMGDIITLSGDLGAGKTVFARAFICALGSHDEVPSPTFSLVQSYDLNPIPVHHFDLYRIERPEDAFELGIEDLIAEGVSLIEWPERLSSYLPKDRLELSFLYPVNQNKIKTLRHIRIAGWGCWETRAIKIIKKLK
tara:strand:- start:509 stop:1000 length:492 start_codon:yes stop_codon:yes gene_type:complete